jgi:hypothetical protein
LARPSEQGRWSIEEIEVAGSPGRRVNAFVRSFGQDDEGEIYLMTSDSAGPSGETGKIYRIVPAAASSH